MKTIAAATLMLLVAAMLLSLQSSGAAQQQLDRATVSARAREIRALEAAMMAAAAEEGADGYMSFSSRESCP